MERRASSDSRVFFAAPYSATKRGRAVTTIDNPTGSRFAQACLIFFVAAIALLVAACGRAPNETVAPRADIELFGRESCPRCDEAKHWLYELRARRPEGTIVVTDVAETVRSRAGSTKAGGR